MTIQNYPGRPVPRVIRALRWAGVLSAGEAGAVVWALRADPDGGPYLCEAVPNVQRLARLALGRDGRRATRTYYA